MSVASVAWFDPAELTTIEDFNRAHLQRERAARERIERVLNRNRKPVRGIPRPVYRDDGKWYPSVSAASRDTADTRVDYICQAIRSDKTCGGYRWAYADHIPAGFFDPFIRAHKGLACVWPWSGGCRATAESQVIA